MLHLLASLTSPAFVLLAAPSPRTLPRTPGVVAVEVPGAQPQDIFYIAGVIGVAAFGVRQVFDSAFPENTNEYVPPTPGKLPGIDNLPFFGGSGLSPADEAEQLRQQLLAAAEAGDLKEAYQLEKKLKNLMAETGMRLVVDEEFQRSEDAEKLPEKW